MEPKKTHSYDDYRQPLNDFSEQNWTNWLNSYRKHLSWIRSNEDQDNRDLYKDLVSD